MNAPQTLVSYAALLGRTLLAGALLVAAISKLSDREALAEAVQAFGILPASTSRLVARPLPWVEASLGVALALGLWTRLAAAAAALLLASFALAIAINLARDNAVECNCFGPFYRGPISVMSLARNVLLIMCAIGLLRVYDGYLSLEAWVFAWPRAPGPAIGELVPLVLATVLVGLGITLVYEITRSFRRLNSPSGQANR